MTLLLKNAELASGQICDLLIENGRIQQMASDLSLDAAEAIDAQGRACGVALQDHHLHLRATAAQAQSWVCDGHSVRSAQEFAEGLRRQAPNAQGWIRVLGYHEAHCGELDGERLNRLRSDVPVRVQHVSGRLWILNQRARELLAVGPWTQQGLLWDQDAWLSRRLRELYPDQQVSLRAVSEQLARYGVVGVTDTSPQNGPPEFEGFARAQAQGELSQRLMMMGNASLNPHYRRLQQQEQIQIGPHKFHLLESALPDLDQLSADIRAAHQHHRPVAFHCVSRTELVFALAALAQAGRMDGDRIEHAGICPDELLADLRGLCVVTQPVFIHDRGDRYLREVEAAEQQNLYRLRHIQMAGIGLAGSSDAPYGSLSPWQGIASAMRRQTRQGQVIGAQEALAFQSAYDLWTGSLLQPAQARSLKPQALADVCLWNRSWSEIRNAPESTQAQLTVKAGHIIHRDGL